MIFRFVLPVFALLLMLIGCGGNGDTTTGGNGGDTIIADPSFANNIQPIFTASCAISGCHNSTAQAGLVLLAGQARNNIVNVNSSQAPSLKRVLPGDAANSYIVHKLEGTQSSGVRMPFQRSPLGTIQISNIKNWINQGAEDN